MWPTDYVPRRQATGDSGTVPTGPAQTILRSVVARVAFVVRCAGIAYTAVQVIIWHAYYAADPWCLAGPVVASAWAAGAVAYLSRHWPSPRLACADSAVYVALALGAQQCVPPAVRDDAFGWLVISMSSQLVVPAWYAPVALSLPLALASPAAYVAGAAQLTMTNTRTTTGTAVLLIMVGSIHLFGRRALGSRAAAADAALDDADRAASEQYAILSRNIERREHERLLHDTVLNTLTALARGARDDVATGDDVAEMVSQCRQDVALIEEALGDPDDPAASARRPQGDLPAEVEAVVTEMRSRGLHVNVVIDRCGAPAVPAPVASAISSAAREALSNVAAHAGTREAWVRVSLVAKEADAEAPGRVQVTVRDNGIGFDLARVDRTRLGLRRSIAERTADCGGQASIWSAPGQGTIVRMSWPAPAEAGESVLADAARGRGSLPW
jgi:signal transduction histidine kinase